MVTLLLIHSLIHLLTSSETSLISLPLPCSVRPSFFARRYPGYYYSYLYAQCISATLWDDLFEACPLDRESGALVRRLLTRSAAEDPAMLLREFGNGKAYVRARGPGSVPTIRVDNFF